MVIFNISKTPDFKESYVFNTIGGEVSSFTFRGRKYTVLGRSTKSDLIPRQLSGQIFTHGLTRQYSCGSENGQQFEAYFYCNNANERQWILESLRT